VQARARRTREKILSQAQRAFAERGFEATNLTEHILTPAGVSVGSFYHQFSNKREVLLEIFEHAITDRHARIKEHIAGLSTESFGETYRSLIVALLDDVDTNPDVWRIQWREYESPDIEIRDRSLVGIPGWIQVSLRVIEPWFPGEHPAKTDVAHMMVLIGMGVVREYCHLDADRRPEIRDRLLGPAVAFAEAGAERLLRQS
jgi:AcrR family transcriptional regulator